MTYTITPLDNLTAIEFVGARGDKANVLIADDPTLSSLIPSAAAVGDRALMFLTAVGFQDNTGNAADDPVFTPPDGTWTDLGTAGLIGSYGTGFDGIWLYGWVKEELESGDLGSPLIWTATNADTFDRYTCFVQTQVFRGGEVDLGSFPPVVVTDTQTDTWDSETAGVDTALDPASFGGFWLESTIAVVARLTTNATGTATPTVDWTDADGDDAITLLNTTAEPGLGRYNRSASSPPTALETTNYKLSATNLGTKVVVTDSGDDLAGLFARVRWISEYYTAYGRAINASGQVAGYIEGSGGRIQAIRWTGTTPERLDASSSVQDAHAYGINDDAVAVGDSGSNPLSIPYGSVQWEATTPDDASGLIALFGINTVDWLACGYGVGTGYEGAFTWDGATSTQLDFLSGGDYAIAYAVNEDAQVVGFSNDDTFPAGQIHAVIWNGISATALDYLSGGSTATAYAVNDSAQVAGFSDDGTDTYAVVWNGTTPTALDTLGGGAPGDIAWGINGAGQAVGVSYDGSFLVPVVWDGTAITLLPLLPGGNVGGAFGVNDSGVICGYADDADGNRHAVIWTPSGTDGYWGVLLS